MYSCETQLLVTIRDILTTWETATPSLILQYWTSPRLRQLRYLIRGSLVNSGYIWHWWTNLILDSSIPVRLHSEAGHHQWGTITRGWSLLRYPPGYNYGAPCVPLIYKRSASCSRPFHQMSTLRRQLPGISWHLWTRGSDRPTAWPRCPWTVF